MKSEYIKYVMYFLLAVLLVIFVQMYFPNPINWNRNFNTNSKDPYGLYVFNEELPQLLPNQNLTKTALTPYEFLLESEQIPAAQTTFLMVEGNRFIDHSSIEKLLEQVKNGADLIITAESFYQGRKAFLDTLNIRSHEIKTNNLHFVSTQTPNKDTLVLKDTYSTIFTIKDAEKHQVIAKMNSNPVFLSSKFGKGTVYICSTPILLTNYYLLHKDENTASFAENFTSFLKKKNVIWFDQNHQSNELANNESIFKVILKNKSWRFGWYTLVCGLILFLIFYGKRKQRIVPIIEPVKNTTVEYIETVGNLYFQENDHTQLLQKKIQHALYFIRTEWNISTQTINQEFKEKLKQKSMAADSDINQFVTFVQQFNLSYKYTQKQLIQFTKLLEKLNIHYGKSRNELK
ncbi:DUF4350 domain-containing protein [Flavobacterium sp. CBA20B-1]|uniref:DUF4350 domain-containing protein n=1 Tax=unclassified Flavobacterium TaxID=196869 RepID=UPI002224E37A|nr:MULTISPECIES: DUF4350 domain-containing protein [unclassified Flavobacterium]WCM42647.1 DUF4350 domain-containing protein [Flavobacterium sp. CBA20B-1]